MPSLSTQSHQSQECSYNRNPDPCCKHPIITHLKQAKTCSECVATCRVSFLPLMMQPVGVLVQISRGNKQVPPQPFELPIKSPFPNNHLNEDKKQSQQFFAATSKKLLQKNSTARRKKCCNNTIDDGNLSLNHIGLL